MLFLPVVLDPEVVSRSPLESRSSFESWSTTSNPNPNPISISTSISTSCPSCPSWADTTDEVVGGNGVEDDWGRRPGKSGTSTVTSVNSTNRLGNGVVVDVVVVIVVLEMPVVATAPDNVVVAEDVVELVDSFDVVDVAFDHKVDGPAISPPEAWADVVMDDVPGLAVVDVTVVVVVAVGTDAFCNPNVFQMDGPTELNHGGLGLAVEDMGAANQIKIKDISRSNKKEKGQSGLITSCQMKF